jgi:hypothetical protein
LDKPRRFCNSFARFIKNQKNAPYKESGGRGSITAILLLTREDIVCVDNSSQMTHIRTPSFKMDDARMQD